VLTPDKEAAQSGRREHPGAGWRIRRAVSSRARAGASFLTLESLNETVDIGDGHGKRRMTLSPKWRRNWFTKMNAHSRRPIGPERQAIIGE
jgi:hypothetical protein